MGPSSVERGGPEKPCYKLSWLGVTSLARELRVSGDLPWAAAFPQKPQGIWPQENTFRFTWKKNPEVKSNVHVRAET